MSAGAGLSAGHRRVDVACVDDARSGQHRPRRQVEPVADVAVQQRHGEVALQIGLLVDRKQLRAALDTLETRLVHVERAELRLALNAGLANRSGGAVGVAGADCDHAIHTGVLLQSGLDRLCNRSRVAKAGRRQRQLARFAAILADSVSDALATGLGVRGARQGVDAEYILGAMPAIIFAAAEARRIFFVADKVHGAEPFGRIHAAGVVDDQRHTGGDDFLEGVVHGFGNPVRTDDGVGMLAQRGADELCRIRAQIVVVLRAEPGHRAARRLGDQACVVGALFDLRPERVIRLTADDENLGPVSLSHCACDACRHQSATAAVTTIAFMRFIVSFICLLFLPLSPIV